MPYELNTELELNRCVDDVFTFFADAGNLDLITPPWLRFEILTPLPIDMRKGAIIEYQIRLHGISVRWKTQILVWEPPHRFVDEQIRGPYRLWVHKHTFEQKGGLTVVRDHVDYDLRCGFIAHRLFVKRDLDRIFTYRRNKLLEAFKGQTADSQRRPS